MEFTITAETISPLALIVCTLGCVAFCILLSFITDKVRKLANRTS
jgi:hypothetical protein